MSRQTQLVNLIYSGSPDGQYFDPIPENILTQTINILIQSAKEEPAYYLQILSAPECAITPMVMLSISILFAYASSAFLSNSSEEIYHILKVYDAKQLYELTHLIKTKTFKKGLGSREQKAIRRVMEAWSADDLKAFMISQGRYLFNLIRIIHPRYQGNKIEVLESLLKKTIKTTSLLH